MHVNELCWQQVFEIFLFEYGSQRVVQNGKFTQPKHNSFLLLPQGKSFFKKTCMSEITHISNSTDICRLHLMFYEHGSFPEILDQIILMVAACGSRKKKSSYEFKRANTK